MKNGVWLLKEPELLTLGSVGTFEGKGQTPSSEARFSLSLQPYPFPARLRATALRPWINLQ